MTPRVPLPFNRLTRGLEARVSSIACPQCQRQLPTISQTQSYSAIQPVIRPFSSTSVWLKKTGKANRLQAHTGSSPAVESSARGTTIDDAFDFSGLQAKIMKSIEQLSHQLSQLRAGGRFNPEKLEELKLQFKDSDGNKRTARLGELAQVSAKGRNVSIAVHEADHVKLVNTTILTSSLNLTPHGPAPETPTTLTIQVPPPTGESRQQALASASKSAEDALGRIREARGAHQKKLRAMQVSRSVRPDDLQKAQKQMEDVVKRGNDDVKKVLEDTKRVLDR